LCSNGKQPTVVVHEPVVEVVEDTPETALQEIHAQLSKLEGSNEETLSSIMRNMPHGSSQLSTDQNNDRLGLLENLEKEMGQQETHWMQMQHNFDRDSNSVILTPQKPLPSPPSESSSRGTSLSVTRRPRIRGNPKRQSNGDESTTTTSTQSSENSKATVWQQRLAEAQTEYMENATTLLNNPHLNFLNFQKGQLGSPTPPESGDSENGSATDMEFDTDDENYVDELGRDASSPEPFSRRPALWEPMSVAPVFCVGHLWCPPGESSMARTPSPEPAAKAVRPAHRRDHHPLSIGSSALWSKPTAHADRPLVGLWGSRMTRPKSIITRPKTQRPARKSKRVTFLPDIRKFLGVDLLNKLTMI
jgi:hypothetical protein